MPLITEVYKDLISVKFNQKILDLFQCDRYYEFFFYGVPVLCAKIFDDGWFSIRRDKCIQLGLYAQDKWTMVIIELDVRFTYWCPFFCDLQSNDTKSPPRPIGMASRSISKYPNAKPGSLLDLVLTTNRWRWEWKLQIRGGTGLFTVLLLMYGSVIKPATMAFCLVTWMSGR